jgi:hypothetical protein
MRWSCCDADECPLETRPHTFTRTDVPTLPHKQKTTNEQTQTTAQIALNLNSWHEGPTDKLQISRRGFTPS